MCVTCVDGCIGMCEIGKSAYRGPEVLYPQPFGIITAGCEKDYPVDLSHFSIMGTAKGAWGVPADSDKATFEKVTIETKIGVKKDLKLKLPFIIAGMGSTNVARQNWAGLGTGAAISGAILTIGENVCGMDDETELKNGRVVRSPDMEFRIKSFRDWQDGYGDVVVQANVEDTRLGVQEYAIEKLGIETVELKWGQGAKDIGGEVKIKTVKKAQALKKKGYIVLPDPDDPNVIAAFEKGSFKEFERHSRLGMVEEEAFMKRVEELRKAGAKRVFLKTGAYRPADLARAVKYASKAKLDLLTVDGAGGGTGMSPWRMMNEWGIPTVEIWSLTWKFADQLAKQGEYVPDLAFAGGITFEDQIFKALALGAPYVKAVGHGPLAPGRGHGRQDDRRPDQRRPDPRLRRALRQQQGRDLRHRARAAAALRGPVRRAPGGGHRRLHLLQAAEPGPPPDDGRRAQVHPGLRHPRRHRLHHQGSGRHQRHPVHHGRRQRRGPEDPQGEIGSSADIPPAGGSEARALLPSGLFLL